MTVDNCSVCGKTCDAELLIDGIQVCAECYDIVREIEGDYFDNKYDRLLSDNKYDALLK